MDEQGKSTFIYRGKTDCQRDVTKVRVDPSVTSIETLAFYDWRSLQRITLPDTITTIGGWVFDTCSSLTEITLPSSTTTLGDCVFYGCSSLISIVLPNSITTIGDSVFKGCSSLASITLSNSITTIGDSVFDRCSSLPSITLPNSITTLGHAVFSRCSSLASITLPPNITSLGNFVFAKCSSLVSVHLPENLNSISLRTFEGCVKLTTIEAPYLSTTTLDNNNFDSFRNLLINAGFSTSNPNDIISNRQLTNTSHYVYYEWKKWARTKDEDDRYPLFTAAARCLKWSYMKQIFTSNMPVVNEIDVRTGLPLFVLAATGPTSDIESVYNLLREYPAAINIMNNNYDKHSTERTRKRERVEFAQSSSAKMPKDVHKNSQPLSPKPTRINTKPGFTKFLTKFKQHQLHEDQKGLPSTSDGGKTLAEHTSAPFCWLERGGTIVAAAEDGGDDTVEGKIYEVKGGRDLLCDWAGKEFPEEESIQALCSVKAPPRSETCFDNTTPGGTWMEHNK